MSRAPGGPPCTPQGVTRHARRPVPSELEHSPRAWPPAGAEPLDDRAPLRPPRRGRLRLRTRLPGARAAWRPARDLRRGRPRRRGGPRGRSGFCLHPALLDAALHAIAARGAASTKAGEVGSPSPSRACACYGRGAGSLRVRLGAGAQGGVERARARRAGAPVLRSTRSLRARSTAGSDADAGRARPLCAAAGSSCRARRPNGARATARAARRRGKQRVPGLEAHRAADLAALDQPRSTRGRERARARALAAQSLADGTPRRRSPGDPRRSPARA